LKGRAFGSIKGTDKAGQRTAAQAWLDALEIHERCPASTGLKDPTIMFPIFSGMVVFLKGGKILQDNDCSFEQNLAYKFVAETGNLGDPVHITRALAMLCEVQARAGQYSDALATFVEIENVYDPEKHSEAICKAYGTDRTAHAFAQSALWHYQLGDIESALKACDYVLEKLLPLMDASNILNTSELLHPILRMLKPRGEEKRLRDLFQERVVDNFEKFEIKFTPALPIFKPLLMLLDICHDPLGYSDPEFEKDVTWLLDENHGNVDDFLDSILVKLGWAANTMVAELCLLFARKLQASNGDMSKVQGLVVKGVKAARKADWKMKDESGNVTLPIAYEMHEPVMTQLQSFAERLGVTVEKESLISEDTGKESLITSLGEVRLA
jgi:tetratricopeptide (TPR) repeat protein